MATPEAIRTQILALVKDYHTAKFAPKTFDPDKNLVHYASRVFDAEEIITGVKAIFSGNERLARQACVKGTRIPVYQIIRMIANGDTILNPPPNFA